MEENTVINTEPKKSNKIVIIIVSIIVAIGAIGAIAVLTLMGNKKEDGTTTTTSSKVTSSTTTSETTTTTTTTTTTVALVKEVSIPKKISTNCKVDKYGVPTVDNTTDSILCGASKLLLGAYRDLQIYKDYPIENIKQLNDMDNNYKLFTIYLWGDIIDNYNSDDILKAYQSIFGKEYSMNFTHIFDSYYEPNYKTDCTKALEYAEDDDDDDEDTVDDDDDDDDDENLEACFYIYDTKTKKYTYSPLHGGHGMGSPKNGYLMYVKPISYKVSGNEHIITYHMIFVDDEEESGDYLIYPILDLKKGQIGTTKLTRYSEGDTITDKVYEKFKSKLSEIQVNFELVDKHLILKSIR